LANFQSLPKFFYTPHTLCPRWRKLAACAQFKILFTAPTQHSGALSPSLLERGNGGEDSTVYFKSLRKAKILKKLLIEKYFISLHSKKQNKLSYVLV